VDESTIISIKMLFYNHYNQSIQDNQSIQENQNMDPITHTDNAITINTESVPTRLNLNPLRHETNRNPRPKVRFVDYGGYGGQPFCSPPIHSTQNSSNTMHIRNQTTIRENDVVPGTVDVDSTDQVAFILLQLSITNA
jgi:hypothetical protein